MSCGSREPSSPPECDFVVRPPPSAATARVRRFCEATHLWSIGRDSGGRTVRDGRSAPHAQRGFTGLPRAAGSRRGRRRDRRRTARAGGAAGRARGGRAGQPVPSPRRSPRRMPSAKPFRRRTRRPAPAVRREGHAEAAMDFVALMTTDGSGHASPSRARSAGTTSGRSPRSPRPSPRSSPARSDHPCARSRRSWSTASSSGGSPPGSPVQSIGSAILPRLPFALAIALALVAAGLVGALAPRRMKQRADGDLPPGACGTPCLPTNRSAARRGSARPDARHGNRLHTAVALLELGRDGRGDRDPTETSRQSQALVDQVTARRDEIRPSAPSSSARRRRRGSAASTGPWRSTLPRRAAPRPGRCRVSSSAS